ncbi:MAG TPA: helix-turn-helix domain-containing protein [Gemmatimonadaceae bacterium]|nr:helix-turn-helix domain-containing protein [Gemmatimonadaceae bacterium]
MWSDVVLHHDLQLAAGGPKGTRAAILIELKRAPAAAPRLTAADLAQRLDVSLNAVRHHLKELESEQLVEYDRERRGVGAPAFAYRLTERGEALFPRRYQGTLLQLLDQVAQRDGRDAAVSMLESQFETIAERLEPELSQASAEHRLEIVSRAMAHEGFMTEWHQTPDSTDVVSHNCALLAVAERFPEICDAERRFLSRTLDASVDRVSHILNGCGACEYSVRFREPGAVRTKET